MRDARVDDFLKHDNYYEALGISRNSSNSEIIKVYRKLAAVFHPDKNKDPRASDAFSRLNNIKDTLTDEHRRSQYDLTTAGPRSYTRPKCNEPKHKQGREAILIIIIGVVILFYLSGGSTDKKTKIGIDKKEFQKKLCVGRSSTISDKYTKVSEAEYGKNYYVPNEWLARLADEHENFAVEDLLEYLPKSEHGVAQCR